MEPLNTVDLLPPVFPSNEKTILVLSSDSDSYCGAHHYLLQKCKGFENGETKYVDEYMEIDFVKKQQDGTVVPGIQNEQLYIMLMDRITKLNAVFPCNENEEMISCLQKLIDLCAIRVKNRIERGVMGDLKK